jgi:hypothetical protein
MNADAPMITKGTFSDFKIIRTRKVAQLVVEIPIEEADAAVAALGGLPRSDRERWVAVARLDMNAANGQREKTRRAFCDLPFPQQAGIKTKDTDFQFWINGGFCSEQDCAAGIRKRCGVESRADIVAGSEAGEKWLGLLREFEGVR